MIFRYGSDVILANGEKGGEVKEIVMDPKTGEVTHIILEKGFLSTEDKVLPISIVEDANENRVKLYELEIPLDDLTDYKEKKFVEVRDSRFEIPVVGNPPFLLPYPPVRPYKKREFELRRYKKEKVKNIPQEVEPIKKGAKVFTLEGQHVGNVAEVIINSQTDDATHLVISKGLLLIEEKLVPFDWVQEYEEEEVHLAVDRQVIENLPEYQTEEKTPL